MISLLTLENSSINRMLRDGRFVEEFPGLRHFADVYRQLEAAGKFNCAPCQKQNRLNKVLDYNAVKRDLAGLASDRKAKLKQLLGAKQVRLIYTGADGKKVIRVTF